MTVKEMIEFLSKISDQDKLMCTYDDHLNAYECDFNDFIFLTEEDLDDLKY